MDIKQVDPEWCWAPYRPSAETAWDRQAAAHLYRRSGFAATVGELDKAVGMEPG